MSPFLLLLPILRTKRLQLPNMMTYNYIRRLQRMKKNAVCITGHRPKSLPWGYDETKVSCMQFKQELFDIFEKTIKNGFNIFYIGMAEGFDMISAEILIKLRKIYRHIRIIAVIPCLNQEKFWSPRQQQRYREIVKCCNKKIVLAKIYTQNCMNERNIYMVNKSSIVIACYNGKSGGTRNTILYAKSKGLKIFIINSCFNKKTL